MPHALSYDRQAAVSALRDPVRLRTLTTLRWLAVAGQLTAIVFVHFGLGFPTPLGLCLAAIAASAWVNLFSVLRFSPQRFLTHREAAALFAFDIIQLSALLAFTGGILNPFSALILAPVMIAANLLPLRLTILVGALALASVGLLSLYHMPLPWLPGEFLDLAPIYKAGVWAALSFSIVFFAAYAHRIAAESAQMRSALAATQLVLDRELRLSALGGLAAAAAHELGTPLATIQLTAKEMLRELKDHEELSGDAQLVVSQVERCRDILSRLSKHGEAGDAVHDRLGFVALLREAAAPFLDERNGPEIRIETNSKDDSPEPVLERRPEVIYGVRNIIENAVSFARRKIVISAEWSKDELSIAVNDDGPGFAPEILARLGEPYVSARGAHRAQGKGEFGLGLGFFIAKTLLESAGAEIAFKNRQWGEDPSERGASVVAAWPANALAAAPLT